MRTLERLRQLTGQLAVAERNERLADIRLRTALRVAGAGVWDWDITADVLRWDDRMVELFGYRSGEFPKDDVWHVCRYAHFMDRVHPDDRSRVQSRIDACLNDHEPYRITYRVVRPGRDTVQLILAAGDLHQTDSEHRLVGVCVPASGALES